MNHSSSAFNQPLTLNELRAYQAGQLSAAEQHRVERLLLENPLYADALDGLEAIQQAGSSLQRQTGDLHEALQERIHEAATPRRLMPLWVTSLAASVLLVLSVSFYLIYSMHPAGTSAKKAAVPTVSHAVQPHIEPGTVLLDINDLGTMDAPTKDQQSILVARSAKIGVARKEHGAMSKKTRMLASASTPTLVPEVVVLSPVPAAPASLPTDPSAWAALADEQQTVLRARTINPERAFSNWPPAVKL